MYIFLAIIAGILLLIFVLNKYGSIDGSIRHWLTIYYIAEAKAKEEGRDIYKGNRKEFYKEVFAVRKGFDITKSIEDLESLGIELSFRKLLFEFILTERKISDEGQMLSIERKINKIIPANL